MTEFTLARRLNKWVNRASLNTLEDAYQGALAIKKIEDTHFASGAITELPEKGKTVSDYFRTQLERQLLRIRFSLLRFNVTNFVVNRPTSSPLNRTESATHVDSEAIILEKLAFIESVIVKYNNFNQSFSDIFSEQVPTVVPKVLETQAADLPIEQQEAGTLGVLNSTDEAKLIKSHKQQRDPSRLFGGAERIRKEFSPKYEKEVIQELRVVRLQNRIATRWLLLLLMVPIVTQILTKNLVLNPLLGNYFERNPTKVELALEIQEEFIRDFSEFRETQEIKRLIGKAIGKAEVKKEVEEKVLQEKVIELWREARYKQLNGLKNVLADCLALLAFIGLVFFGRKRLAVVRNFANRAFLSLNDPSKIFLFILITDMFVGFHSAEGWDVILGGITHHFGLPESQVLNKSFIATIPVIADSCIKFWIFNYLTRYSPSASAIYERMSV